MPEVLPAGMIDQQIDSAPLGRSGDDQVRAHIRCPDDAGTLQKRSCQRSFGQIPYPCRAIDRCRQQKLRAAGKPDCRDLAMALVRHRRTGLTAGLNIPEASGRVIAGRGDPSAVAAECQVEDAHCPVMRHQRPDLRTSRGIPETETIAPAARDDCTGVRELDSTCRTLMTALEAKVAIRQVPDLDRFTRSDCGKLAVGGDCNVGETFGLIELPQPLPVGGVEDPHMSVLVAGCEHLTVR